jgi:hypothetical protein
MIRTRSLATGTCRTELRTRRHYDAPSVKIEARTHTHTHTHKHTHTHTHTHTHRILAGFHWEHMIAQVNRIEDNELRHVLFAMPNLTVIGFYGESLRDADSDSGWYVSGKLITDDGLVLDY